MSRPASLAIAGAALAGVLAGHALTYALVTLGSPEGLLAATGHGYLDAAVRIGLATGVFAVLALFADRLRTALAGTSGRRVGTEELFIRLASIQACTFLLQEIGERWISGAPVSGVLARGLLGIGLVSQLALAALGARFLRWVLRTADRIGGVLRGARPSAGSTPAPPVPPRERPTGAILGALTAWSLRGPPRPRARTLAR